ncbi:MAG: helix-turn-helix transcriptional regulator [Pseudomonadota bacterium]
MNTQFAADLRLARRKAGFIQSDVAHLLSSHRTVVSDLECGVVEPSLEQIVDLSLIYGRSFDSFFARRVAEEKAKLRERLRSMPPLNRETAETVNRAGSLRKLKRRLDEDEDGGA